MLATRLFVVRRFFASDYMKLVRFEWPSAQNACRNSARAPSIAVPAND
jgi:hypothetical protein